MLSLWMAARAFNSIFNNGLNQFNKGYKNSKPQLVVVRSGFPMNGKDILPKKGKCGDDAYFIMKTKQADVIGIADSVGGWQIMGINAGNFAYYLMNTCAWFVKLGLFFSTSPIDLLSNSYYELGRIKHPIVGSSTACIIMLNKKLKRLFCAHIGDSAFMIVRDGYLINGCIRQMHYFNCPFQLSLPPPEFEALVVNDHPNAAISRSISVVDGDVILLATDGLFDNVPENILADIMATVQGERNPAKLQTVANSIALLARVLSYDNQFVSPFIENAILNEIGIPPIGGGPSDILVILATVAF